MRDSLSTPCLTLVILVLASYSFHGSAGPPGPSGMGGGGVPLDVLQPSPNCNGFSIETVRDQILSYDVIGGSDLAQALEHRECYCLEVWEEPIGPCPFLCIPPRALNFTNFDGGYEADSEDDNADANDNVDEGSVDQQHLKNDQGPEFQCLLIAGTYYYGIRSCPDDYPNETIKSLCEDELPTENVTMATIQAVTDISKERIFFNQYCATCNQVQEVQRWKAHIRCENRLHVMSALTPEEYFRLSMENGSTCRVIQEHDKSDAFRCDPTFHIQKELLISACNTSGKEISLTGIEEKCDHAQNDRRKHVARGQYLFKNIFCAVCNSQAMENPECTEPIASPGPPLYTFLFGSVHGWNGDMEEGDQFETQCQHHEWKDPKRNCRPILCSKGKLSKGDRCKTALPEVVRGLPYRISFLMSAIAHVPVADGSVRDTTLEEVANAFCEKIRERAVFVGSLFAEILVGVLLDQQFVGILANISKSGVSINNSNNVNDDKKFLLPLSLWTNIFVVTSMMKERDEVEELFISELSSTSYDISIGDSFTTSYQLRFVDGYAYDLLSSCERILPITDTKECGIFVQRFKGFDLNRIEQKFENSYPLLPKSKLVEMRPSVMCNYVELSRTEVQETFEVSPVPHVKHIAIQFGDYSTELTEFSEINQVSGTLSGTFYVCLDILRSKNYAKRTDASSLMTSFLYVMTIVCISASFVCLLATVTTYSLFSDLRNVADCNTLGLSLSLMVAQVFLFVANYVKGPSILCTAIGILTHFSWLVMFSWTFLCCLNIFKVFAVRPSSNATSRINQRKENREKMMNVLLSLGVPVSIVIIIIITNMVMHDGTRIGYGYRTCLMDSPYAINGPLIFVIICNTIFFAVAVYKMWGLRRLQHNADIRQDVRKDVIIYIKLSTLTGMFWLLVVLGEVLDNDVIRCLAIVANGLQGVFIFISFVLNHRVLKYYKEKINIGRPPLTSSTAATNSNACSGGSPSMNDAMK